MPDSTGFMNGNLRIYGLQHMSARFDGNEDKYLIKEYKENDGSTAHVLYNGSARDDGTYSVTAEFLRDKDDFLGRHFQVTLEGKFEDPAESSVNVERVVNGTEHVSDSYRDSVMKYVENLPYGAMVLKDLSTFEEVGQVKEYYENLGQKDVKAFDSDMLSVPLIVLLGVLYFKNRLKKSP